MCSWTWVNTARSASFGINRRLLTGRRFENEMSFPDFLRRGCARASFHREGKWLDPKEEFSIHVIAERSSSRKRQAITIDVGIGAMIVQVFLADFWTRLRTSSQESWRNSYMRRFFITTSYKIVFNFVLFFHSGSDDSKFIPDIIDFATKKSTYVIRQRRLRW